MGNDAFLAAASLLQRQFDSLDWTLHNYRDGEKMYRWPAGADEDVAVVVHRSDGEREPFHRHDFFFFNYTYSGRYDSLSQRYNNQITIREGEVYAGQPLAGHALFAHDNAETIIIGLLVKPRAFFRYFLPLLPTDAALFRFFIDPQSAGFFDEFIHFRPRSAGALRAMLELMVIEYAAARPGTQPVLRALAVGYLNYIVREYAESGRAGGSNRLLDRLVAYLNQNLETAALGAAAQQLGYHPSYLSALIKKQTGATFSALLLKLRMERAAALLRHTALSVSEISPMLGYSNTSNFYKAFKAYYNASPRESARRD